MAETWDGHTPILHQGTAARPAPPSTRRSTMPGLSASELPPPPESLHAGDTIEYSSLAFVSGDPRGRRVAVILRVSDAADEDFPIGIDNGELIPVTFMIVRRIDRFGNEVQPGSALWRKLRTFSLVAGSCEAPTRASLFNAALQGAIDACVDASMRQLRGACEETRSQSEEDGMGRSGDEAPEARAPATTTTAPADSGAAARDQPATHPREDTGIAATPESPIYHGTEDSDESSPMDRAAESTQIDATDSGNRSSPRGEASASEGMSTGTVHEKVATPLLSELAAAEEYLSTIPTRHERSKIRHQPKKRSGAWHVPRSRQRRNQKKCGITRSGREIYHGHTLKARKTKELLKLPMVKTRLKNLRVRRPRFEQVVASRPGIPTGFLVEDWPADVKYITESIVPEGITFPDIGEPDLCQCEGDCFLDTCWNATAATFCTPACCRLEAVCSNSPRSLPTLKLFDTRRVGLGVFTTTSLDVGDVLGEYCGKLCAYDAIVEGQPDQALKQNSGYTMLLNAKSTSKQFVYIEALEYGFTTRYMSHSCRPNVAFMEMQNGTDVKVLAVMISNVNAGAELTVNYGDEIWFKCTCDECWFGY